MLRTARVPSTFQCISQHLLDVVQPSTLCNSFFFPAPLSIFLPLPPPLQRTIDLQKVRAPSTDQKPGA